MPIHSGPLCLVCLSNGGGAACLLTSKQRKSTSTHMKIAFFYISTTTTLLDFTQETVAVCSFASSITMWRIERFGDDEAVVPRIWLSGRIHVKQYLFCELRTHTFDDALWHTVYTYNKDIKFRYTCYSCRNCIIVHKSITTS
jgi:hypothetical protein